MTDKRLAPGDPAPELSLLDADGKEVSLSSFRG
jgi:peroxiredoxin Q/BCP